VAFAAVFFTEGSQFGIHLTLPSFDVYMLSLAGGALSRCEPGCRPLGFSADGGRHLPCRAADIASLRDTLSVLFDGVFSPSALPGSPLLPRGLSEGLAGLLWQTVAGSVGSGTRPLAHHKRSRVLVRARDWLTSSPGQALSVAAMSRELGIPERSLRRAFVEQFRTYGSQVFRNLGKSSEYLHILRAWVRECPLRVLVAIQEGFWDTVVFVFADM
jgi:hypothetical protein